MDIVNVNGNLHGVKAKKKCPVRDGAPDSLPVEEKRR
jgi:hypothetical protein